MQDTEITICRPCPSADISAYIDRELSADDELTLELHIAECEVCYDDLNLQKTFLNALESSLDDGYDLELPSNFTRSVVTSAESGVSGLRRSAEWRSAALISLCLVFVSMVAFGGKTRGGLAAVAAVGEKIGAILSSGFHFLYDVSRGSTIVFRSLASNFVFESGVGAILVLAVFLLSLFLVSKLMFRLHRT